MDNKALCNELEKTAAELEAQAASQAEKNASEKDTSSYSEFLDAVVGRFGFTE